MRQTDEMKTGYVRASLESKGTNNIFLNYSSSSRVIRVCPGLWQFVIKKTRQYSKNRGL